jgi:hypothetical protein
MTPDRRVRARQWRRFRDVSGTQIVPFWAASDHITAGVKGASRLQALHAICADTEHSEAADKTAGQPAPRVAGTAACKWSDFAIAMPTAHWCSWGWSHRDPRPLSLGRLASGRRHYVRRPGVLRLQGLFGHGGYDAVRQWPEFARPMTRSRFFSTNVGSASSIQCGALTDSQMPGDQCRTNALRSRSSATSPRSEESLAAR